MRSIISILFLIGIQIASMHAQSFQLVDKESLKPINEFSLLLYFESQAIKVDGKRNGTIKINAQDLKNADSIFLRHNFQRSLLEKDLFKKPTICIDSKNQLEEVFLSNSQELNNYGIEKGNHTPHGYLQNKIVALKIPAKQIKNGQIISMNVQFKGKNLFMKHDLKGRSFRVVIGYESNRTDSIHMLYNDKDALNVISESKSQWVEIDLWDQDLFIPKDAKSLFIGIEPLEKHTMLKTAKKSDYPETSIGFMFLKDGKWVFVSPEYTSLPKMYITTKS